MSKAVRKVLPVIPAGVEPALSPRVPHSSKPVLSLLAHSPLLPRSSSLPHSKVAQLKAKENCDSISAGGLHNSRVERKVQRSAGEDGEDSAVTVAVRVRPFSRR